MAGRQATDISCDWRTGFFAYEPLNETLFTTLNELRAVCQHEAAHAVAMYAFGQGVKSATVTERREINSRGELTVDYGGQVRPRRRVGGTRIPGIYGRWHFVEGVITAAGPAADRKFRIEAGLPLRMLVGVQGDYATLVRIGAVLNAGGRNSDAYCRLVWRAAQRAVEDAAFWAATSEIADFLKEQMLEADEKDTVCDTVASIDARLAHRICRKHGIKQGQWL